MGSSHASTLSHSSHEGSQQHLHIRDKIDWKESCLFIIPDTNLKPWSQPCNLSPSSLIRKADTKHLVAKNQLSPVLYSLLRYTVWNKVPPEQIPAGLGSTTQNEFYTGGLKLWNYGVQKKKSTQNLKINLKSASTQPTSHTICALCINNQETSQVKCQLSIHLSTEKELQRSTEASNIQRTPF